MYRTKIIIFKEIPYFCFTSIAKSMQKKTIVTFNPLKVRISQEEKIVSLGSCFSTEIGRLMELDHYKLLNNPFGVLFNPASIASSIKHLAEPKEFTFEDVIPRNTNPIYDDTKWTDEGYVSFHHHGSFRRETPEAFLKNANDSLKSAAEHFFEAKWCLVTFGTAWVYRHIDKDIIVSNCHKHPSKEFRREFLTIGEIVAMYRPIINEFPDKEWIFTLSPIRHIKDGLHENQISKATLLLSIESLVREYDNVHYFPSYEIVLDEMRDYSHFAEDSVHPSEQTIALIYEKFKSFAL